MARRARTACRAGAATTGSAAVREPTRLPAGPAATGSPPATGKPTSCAAAPARTAWWPTGKTRSRRTASGSGAAAHSEPNVPGSTSDAGIWDVRRLEGDRRGVEACGEHGQGDAQVLDGEAGRVEQGDLLLAAPSLSAAQQDISDLGDPVARHNAGRNSSRQLPALRRLFPLVAEQAAPLEGAEFDLGLPMRVRS